MVQRFHIIPCPKLKLGELLSWDMLGSHPSSHRDDQNDQSHPSLPPKPWHPDPAVRVSCVAQSL